MAHTTIHMTNGVEIKSAPIGFSWTTFFFGGFPALLRQDWKMGAIILVASMFTYGLAGIVAAFMYNKLYLKSLFESGYKIHSMGNMTEDQLKAYLGYVNLPGQEQK